HRQRRIPRARKLAQQQLALELEAHEEEEERHQAFVHPAVERKAEPEAPTRDEGKLPVPGVMPGVASDRRGERERGDRGRDQDEATRCFVGEESLERGSETA